MNSTRSAIVTAVIFSKDRALQLEAVIKSLWLHCLDANLLSLAVIYTGSSEQFLRQYQQLENEYPNVDFILERDFRRDVFKVLGIPVSLRSRLRRNRIVVGDTLNKFVLFLVDDNIFIRDFHIFRAVTALEQETTAVGFALQLGRNITYCYPLDIPLKFPENQILSDDVIKYRWTDAGDGLNYPLEVSSSLYRQEEITSLLMDLRFSNPNTLESQMAIKAAKYHISHPYLLCYKESVTFCNPLNKVQSVYGNRSGGNKKYSAASLAQLFDEGYHIDVNAYQHFTPVACHQEVELFLSGLS